MGILRTKNKTPELTHKDINDVASFFNHALVTGDCGPMNRLIDSLSEYTFNLFGVGGTAFGEQAPGVAREDFASFERSSKRFDTHYEDGMFENNRGFWMIRLTDRTSGEEYLGALSLSLNSDNQLSRLMFIVDRPVR